MNTCPNCERTGTYRRAIAAAYSLRCIECGFTNRVEIAENDTRRVTVTECAAVRIHAYVCTGGGMRAHDARQMLAGCRTVAVRAEAQNLRALQTANFSANRADALNILDAELAERERFGCAY